MNYFLKMSLAILMCCCTLAFAESTETKKLNSLPTAMVLDYEILGDTSLENYHEHDNKMVKLMSDYLRTSLKTKRLFMSIDSKEALKQIATEAQSVNLQRCNGCERKLAKSLGADVVVVPWVFRMSILIQTMYIEIRDVKTGHILVHKGRNFRGNTEQGWIHAADRLMEDL